MSFLHPTGLLVEELARDLVIRASQWEKLPTNPVWLDNDLYIFQFVGDWNPPDLSGGFLWVRLRYFSGSPFVGRAEKYYLKRDYQIIELPIPQNLRDRGFDSISIEARIGGRTYERTDSGEILLPKINAWEIAGY